MANEKWTVEGPDDKGGYLIRDQAGEVRGKYADENVAIHHHVWALQHIDELRDHHVWALQHIDELRALFDIPERPKEAVLESLEMAANCLRASGELQHGLSILIDRFVARVRKMLSPDCGKKLAKEPLTDLLAHCCHYVQVKRKDMDRFEAYIAHPDSPKQTE